MRRSHRYVEENDWASKKFNNNKSASKLSAELRKNNKSIFSKIIDIILLILVFIIITTVIVAGTGGYVAYSWVNGIISDTPKIEVHNIYKYMEQSSKVFDSEGNRLMVVESPIRREIVKYNDIPEIVVNAFIAIEDERFWEHPGFDLRRIIGAAYSNYKDGTMQGASTINQQLAKNLFLTNEKTYERKIRDVYYAVSLEKQLSKEQVLEAYLNQVYLGRGAYGVQAAAQVYFGKDVGQLNLPEAAYLAAIPQNPTRFALVIDKRNESLSENDIIIGIVDDNNTSVINRAVVNRKNAVLDSMLRNNMIRESDYKFAKSVDLREILVNNRNNIEYKYSWFLMDMVQDETVAILMETFEISEVEAYNMWLYGGLDIKTTIDMEKQSIVENFYSNDSNFLGYNPETNQPQSSFVLLDYKTGEIKALIGGRNIDAGRRLFNRAIEPRQPGSAMKVIASYFPAIENGYSPDVYIEDRAFYYDLNNPTKPWPSNWYGGYRGSMTLTKAVGQSSNVAAVHQLGKLSDDHSLNLATMREALERLGLSTVIRKSNAVSIGNQLLHDEVYSTVLGGMTYGVSPLEMAAAYGVFANQGEYRKPTVITEIRNNKGEVIFNGYDSKQVTSSGVAYLMHTMLLEAVNSGTGSRASFTSGNKDIPVAGKTGTTTNNRDAWFIGYTPYYAATVWVGNDMNENLPSGSAMAAGIWSKLMAELHLDYEPAEYYEQPDDVITVLANPLDNSLATRHSARVNARYAAGLEPTEYSVYSPPPITVEIIDGVVTVSEEERIRNWENSNWPDRGIIPVSDEDQGGI